MKTKIAFEIECGGLTCSSEPGKFCQFVTTSRFGTQFHCHLFSEQSTYDHRIMPLDEIDGWLKRHDGCLKNGEE